MTTNKKSLLTVSCYTTRLRSNQEKRPECAKCLFSSPGSQFVNASNSKNISKPAFILILVIVIVIVILLLSFLAVAEVVEPTFTTVEKVDRDGDAPLRAPSDKLVPTDDALATAIPAHTHGAPEVLRDPTVPAGLANRAVDSVDVFPALIGRDLG